jgi:ATP-dependent DNA helicase RecQ
VKVPTILAHLKTWVDEGNSLNPDGVLKATELSERLQERVMKSMKKIGPDLLKPVYDDLKGEVSYNDLRVMQLYYLASKK